MALSKTFNRIATSSRAFRSRSSGYHCLHYRCFPQNYFLLSALIAATSTIILPKSVGVAFAMSSSSSTSQTFQTRLTQFVGQSRSSIHESILDTVGQTPIVKLQKLAPEGVNVYVKLESENPGGSIKDRFAMGAIEWAEQTGAIKPGQTVVEATSGNTGIGLAMVCAVKGYPLVCVMSESFSVERRKLMRFLGAKVVLTNPAHKATGMVIKAQELAEKHGYFYPNQFENEANAWIHEHTTGPEIVKAFEGKTLDHFVTAYGTGGNVLGMSRVLRRDCPDTKIHLCEPSNAPMLYSEIPTTYPANGEGPSTQFELAHPIWRPHLFQGWAADFIPKLVTKAQEENVFDELCHPDGQDGVDTSRQLAIKEGIFTGTSGGGILSAALKIARDSPPGTNILAILPDTGERYLSTPLFDGIPADMTDEEKALADSTPSTPPPQIGLPDVTPEAVDFVNEQVSNHKVVVWSLEYCEFCWTLSRFLTKLGVPFERIDIDSFKFAKGQLGNKYRSALQEKTGIKTFPQFFVHGKFVGGAVDACMMWKKGELQPLLTDAGLAGDNKFNGYEGDPFEFLPKWMTANPLGDK